MKTILSLIIIVLLAGNVTWAQFTKAEVQAAGLTCSMCSRAVDKQLRTLDFIDSVGIDLSHATFFLFFKMGKDVDFSQIKKKVEDAGFSVASLKATYKFDNLKIENNYHFVYRNTLYHFMNVKPQTLNGAVAFRIISKGFVSDKEYIKYANEIATYESSEKGTLPDVNRVYHMTL